MFEICFLKELTLHEYFITHLPEFIDYITFFSVYTNSTANIHQLLPDYEEDEKYYDNKIDELRREFFGFLNITNTLDHFVKTYCIIPESEKPMIVKEKELGKTFFTGRSTIKDKFAIVKKLEAQIEWLVYEVTHNHFKDLGFVYESTK